MPQFKPSDSVKPSLDLTNTDAEALDVTGGAEFGSGNVELIGVDGKINGPLSSSIIDDLDGSNLTGVVATTLSATLAVNKGGTGADTLTDGGVLLGSGTGAVTPMAVLADGEVIVGDGSGDPVAESGATLRTSIGLGTGDSPQFDDIELGHASDTTIARASAGNVTIEGNEIYRAGGTDVPVSDGGTGASTFTDGGVLLGSGTNAVTAMAVLADGEMIVGDGTTDPVAESGATLRTSVGVGTGDSPEFTGVNVGHASDTTVTRASSGDLNVEGNLIYRAGGTDVPVADGGTGASSLTDGGVLLGSGTSAVTAMAVLSDGEMIVGDGSTDPVAESGATLRTSIGVGTGDSPQLTAIELGHASDTTIARASAGNVTIEGNAIYRAGGDDVPVADGGTGRSTLTDGGILIGKGTAAINQMAVLADGEMIVGDGTTDPVAETGSTLRASIGCDAAGNITSGTVATARLGSGTASSGTYLRGDSSWAAIAAGGKVLQVVSATHGTQVTNTSATLADTGLTAALTPAATSSKILVYGGMNGCRKDGSTGLGLALCEDIGGAGYSCFQNTFEGLGGYDAGSGTVMFGGVTFGAVRSPSTTSAVTYKVQLKTTLGSGTAYTNGSNAISWMILVEIGA